MMNPSFTSFLIFSIFVVSAFAAMRLRRALPDHHVTSDTKDTVKLTMGLVATMTALMLGLLVASTKQAYDAEKGEVTQMAAKIIFLDRTLADYGPEAAGTRALLRRTVEKAIAGLWPVDAKQHAPADPTASWSDRLPASIQQLAPQNEAQRAVKSEAARLASELG